jgi:hypothetical protein
VLIEPGTAVDLGLDVLEQILHLGVHPTLRHACGKALFWGKILPEVANGTTGCVEDELSHS